MTIQDWNAGWYLCLTVLAGFVLAVFAQLQLFTFVLSALVLSAFLALGLARQGALLTKGLLLGLLTWGYAAWRIELSLGRLPQAHDVDRVYQIQGRVRGHFQTQFGEGLLLEQLVVLRPAEVTFRLGQLKVYTPRFEQPPQSGSSFTAWVRLRKRKASQVIEWPMQRWREHYWPQVYGQVKTLQLAQYEVAAPKPPSALNAANRELIGALLQNDFSPLWAERLNPLGMGHLLAVSGLHFGLFFLLIQVPLALIRKPQLRVWISVVCLVAFAHWMGWTASVTRACCMLLLWLGLPRLQRNYRSLRLWMGLLLLGLMFDPLALLKRGFWYTFAASAGLLLGYRYRAPTPLEHPWLKRLRPFLPIVSAQMMVVPIHLIFDVEARWDSVFWNMLGFPALLLIGVQLCLALIGHLLPKLASLANGSDALLERLLRQSEQLPDWTLLRMPYEPLWVLIFLLMAMLIMARSQREWRWYLCFSCLLVCLARGMPQQGQRWIMFDVGQGACMLYVQEDGRGWLFDAGGRLPAGIDLMQVLRLHGVRDLQAAFISHCNQDHYDLIESLPADLPIYVPHTQVRPFQKLEATYGERRWLGLQRGDQLDEAQFQIEVMWPPDDSRDSNLNETGLVLVVRHIGGQQVLLMGDAGHVVERQIGELGALSLLQVGHHGSQSATGADFVQRVKPGQAWISCGRGNRFGHPHESAIEALDCAGVPFDITALRGSLYFDLE